jgi:hypothetical protein
LAPIRENPEIAVILFSDAGREINFREHVFLDINEQTPAFFWGATGGFELIADAYLTLFRGFDFYVSLEAIRFLLHSLFWLPGKTTIFDTESTYPDSVVGRFPGGKFIRLHKQSEEVILFSYPSPEPVPVSQRGNRHFAGEAFHACQWADAVHIALREYFDILEPVIKQHPQEAKTKILLEYLVEPWHRIRG